MCDRTMWLRWLKDNNHCQSNGGMPKTVFSISCASMLNSSLPSMGEIQNLRGMLSGCFTVSPPTMANSACSRFPCKPRAIAKSLQITVVVAPLSIRTLPFLIRPLGALKRTLATGKMLLLSNTDPTLLVGGSVCNREWWNLLHPLISHFFLERQSLVI